MKSFLIIVCLVMSSFSFSQKPKTNTDSIKKANQEHIDYVLTACKGKEKIGNGFPIFNARDIDDKLFDSSITGKIVFYNVWYTHCTPCVVELPMLNEIKEQFKDQVEFISITFEKKEDIVEFTKKHPFDFRHVIMEKSKIEALALSRGYPTTFIVNNGTIVYCHHGGPSDKDSIIYKPLQDKYIEMIEKSLKSNE